MHSGTESVELISREAIVFALEVFFDLEEGIERTALVAASTAEVLFEIAFELSGFGAVGVGIGVAKVVFGDAFANGVDVLIEFEKAGVVFDTVPHHIAGVWFVVFPAVSADIGFVLVSTHCACSWLMFCC